MSSLLPRASGGGVRAPRTEGVFAYPCSIPNQQEEEKTPSVSLRDPPPPQARGRRVFDSSQPNHLGVFVVAGIDILLVNPTHPIERERFDIETRDDRAMSQCLADGCK